MDARIEELLKQMTLEEKVSLCSGADAWHTRAIERLGITFMEILPAEALKEILDDLAQIA